ncbi:Calycin-like protein [Aspergillus karnatakaensis]|uniref:Calycin-like protein n=1 Tax=Aspergillus karnatakaensis TaxID=1810916 RepID=UPI003CCE52EA
MQAITSSPSNKTQVCKYTKMPSALTPNTTTTPPTQSISTFETDLQNLHLIYDYTVKPPSPFDDSDSHSQEIQKWRYEMYFHSPRRIIYAIHGGPMAGRKNFQAATYQRIRAHELWQVDWLEETGTICSLVYDIPNGKVTTLLGFSKGHWECNEAVKGDERNKEDLERWRGLASIGNQRERVLLSEQADVVEKFWGLGGLEGIDLGWDTM